MSYQKADITVTNTDVEGQASLSPSAPLASQNSKKWWVIAATIAMAGCLFVESMSSSSSLERAEAITTNNNNNNVELLGVARNHAAPACTFAECKKSNCNAEAAPYLCLMHNGGPHGGCSPTPWIVPDTCTTQCDSSGCDDLDIPDSQGDCSGKCSEEWCEGMTSRLCGKSAPYQCTSGASAIGCAKDKYQWTFRTSNAACNACCDATSCED